MDALQQPIVEVTATIVRRRLGYFRKPIDLHCAVMSGVIHASAAR